MAEQERSRIERALQDAAACETLVRELIPVIEREVFAALVRWRRHNRDAQDLVQDVLLQLFENDGAVLRSWDPGRGASLHGFVSIVAARRVSNILHSGRRSASKEDPVDPGDFDADATTATSPEALAASRQLLARLLARLEAELSDQGRAVFRALFQDQRPVAWLVEHMGMTPEAVYTWRSRLTKRARELREQIE